MRGTDDDVARDAELSEWEKFMRIDAAVNGGVVPPASTRPYKERAVRLLDSPPPLPSSGSTENELNALITECRYLMHEVAFNSARLTYSPEDRIRYMAAAESMAIAAAKVGETVGKLRDSAVAPPVETRRHELIYIHASKETTHSPRRLAAENDKQ